MSTSCASHFQYLPPEPPSTVHQLAAKHESPPERKHPADSLLLSACSRDDFAYVYSVFPDRNFEATLAPPWIGPRREKYARQSGPLALAVRPRFAPRPEAVLWQHILMSTHRLNERKSLDAVMRDVFVWRNGVQEIDTRLDTDRSKALQSKIARSQVSRGAGTSFTKEELEPSRITAYVDSTLWILQCTS